MQGIEQTDTVQKYFRSMPGSDNDFEQLKITDRLQKKKSDDYKMLIIETLEKYSEMWREIGTDSPEIYRVIDLIQEYY